MVNDAGIELAREGALGLEIALSWRASARVQRDVKSLSGGYACWVWTDGSGNPGALADAAPAVTDPSASAATTAAADAAAIVARRRNVDMRISLSFSAGDGNDRWRCTPPTRKASVDRSSGQLLHRTFCKLVCAILQAFIGWLAKRIASL
jgi:hypothetical protein